MDERTDGRIEVWDACNVPQKNERKKHIQTVCLFGWLYGRLDRQTDKQVILLHT